MLNHEIELAVDSRKTYRIRSERIGTAEDAAQVFEMVFHLGSRTQESFFALFLDKDNAILGVAELARGDDHHCIAAPMLVLQRAILLGAVRVIVAHTHPSGGGLRPSKQDWKATFAVARACHRLGIQLLDHLILSHSMFVSLVDLMKAHREDVTVKMHDIVCHRARIIAAPAAGEGVLAELPVVSVRLLRGRTEVEAPSFLRSPREAASAFQSVFHLDDAASEDDRLCVFFLDCQDAVIGKAEIRQISRFRGKDLARIVYCATILHNADGISVAEREAAHLSYPQELNHGFLQILNMGNVLGIHSRDYFLFGTGEYASLMHLVCITKKKGNGASPAEIFQTLRRPTTEMEHKLRRRLP